MLVITVDVEPLIREITTDDKIFMPTNCCLVDL